MEPEDKLPLPAVGEPGSALTDMLPDISYLSEPPLSPAPPPLPVQEPSSVEHVLFGRDGLRAGWSVALFLGLFILFLFAIGFVMSKFSGHPKQEMTPADGILMEVTPVGALLAAASILAKIERRSLLAYNLAGPRRVSAFFWGCVTGLVGISTLIGSLYLGGWLKFNPGETSGLMVLRYGVLWGLAFLLVGFFEEGAFRCYLLFTFTRGFGSGKRGFWWAAVTTSVFFGAIHITNTGESQIGVFSAAAIGFIFCLSIWLTGSAWWALGCHAAWDWGETFVYGSADSGITAQGHWFSTSPSGAAFWSGGATGPEGSLLALPAVLVILLLLVAVYGVRRSAAMRAAVQLPGAGRIAG